MNKVLLLVLFVALLQPLMSKAENEEKEYSKLAMINDYTGIHRTIEVGDVIWLKTLQNSRIIGALKRVNHNSIVIDDMIIPLSQIKKVRLKTDASTQSGCCVYGVGISLISGTIVNIESFSYLDNGAVAIASFAVLTGVGLIAIGLPTYRNGKGFNVSLRGHWTLIPK